MWCQGLRWDCKGSRQCVEVRQSSGLDLAGQRSYQSETAQMLQESKDRAKEPGLGIAGVQEGCLCQIEMAWGLHNAKIVPGGGGVILSAMDFAACHT